jgi:histidinol-phosphate aminotransferase
MPAVWKCDSMREPRPSVRTMRPYVPPTGDRLGALRLDFNENTTSASDAVLSAIKNAITGDVLAAYPDYSRTLPAIARGLGVEPDQLVLTNGTDEAIQLLVNTFLQAGDRLAILEPSYAMYRFYAEVAGVEVVPVAYRLADDLAFPLDDLLAVLDNGVDAVFIANPNNPTGRAVPLDSIRRIVERAGRALVLVDEAYVEFSGISALDLIGEYPNVLVSRTFSKAYGLAGLRCGCLVSRSETLDWVRRAQSPYSVNALAAVAAAAAIADPDYVAAYTAMVLAARRFTSERLRALGYRVFPSDGNFVLFVAGERKTRLLAALHDEGVLVRDRSHEIDGCLRVTIGTQEQMNRFIKIVEEHS